MRDMGESEILRRAIDGRLLDVRTSMAATVVSFDANTMTATIRPGVRVQAVDADSDPEVDTLDDLEDVPVLFPHFGPVLLYHPLSAGDIGRLEFSEEDDSEIYSDENASVPVNPLILERHGGHAVFRPEGFRGAGALGSEASTKGFLGTPGGVGMTFDADEMRLGSSTATDWVALASLVESAIAAAIAGHTHSGVTTGPGATGGGALAGPVQSVAALQVKAK